MSDWLDLEPQNPTPSAPVAPPADDDWLLIEDPNAGKTPLAFQHLIDQCMRGTDRVMATDHRYLAFRPYNREKDKETNPRTKERVNRFLAEGKWKHLGTWDEVQVYELLDGNPYGHRKNYVIGQNYRDDIDKVARAALERHWSDYHDLMQAIASALKGGRDPLFAKAMWGDTLQHVAARIKQLGGPEAPSDREINEGFMSIRQARGIAGKGGMVMTLDSQALHKVEFRK